MPRATLLVVLMACAAVNGMADDELEPVVTLEADYEPHALEIRVRLVHAPAHLDPGALEPGSSLRIEYPIRVRSRRRAWWDDRIWRADVVVSAAFDPVTGRYTCEQVLDGAIVEYHDAADAAAVMAWLTAPPPVRVTVPERYADNTLRVRTRAVFKRSTTWLVFPSVEATRWTERELVPRQGEP